MAIRNEQIEVKAKRQKAGADPVVASDEGVFQTKMVGSVVEAFFFDNQGRAIQITDNGVLKAPVFGEANTASNAGSLGDGIFKQKVGVDLQFKRLRAGPGVQLNAGADDIEIVALPPPASGEANTGANVGLSGANVFKEKAGVELRFRRIKAGSNTSVTVTANDEIEISATGGGSGGGEANTASNLGTGSDGEGLFTTKSGSDLPFKRIRAGGNISLVSGPNSVTINATGEANTLGAAGTSADGESLAGGKSGIELLLKRIKAGAGVAVSSDANSVTVTALAGTGEANTASHSTAGTGTGLIFKQKVGVDLIFKKIRAGTNISITNDTDDIVISAAGGGGSGEVNTASNSTASSALGIFKAKVGVDLVFKRLKAGTGVTLTDGTDEITINASGGGSGEVNTASNATAGTGVGLVFKGKVGVDLVFKKIKAGANITVTNETDDVTIAATAPGEVNTASNASAGTGTGLIFKGKSGVDLVFKKLKAGTGVTISDGTDDITINASGGGSGEANTASNLGTSSDGLGVFSSKVGVDLQFKRLKAGSGVSLTDEANDILISVTGGSGGATLSRYSASSVSGEEVYVLADGPGITYSRSGATGTFTIPSGVRLISARVRAPMPSVGGPSFTVVYGFGGSNGVATGFSDFYPPNLNAWREDTGAQIAASSTFGAGTDRIQVNGLPTTVACNIKLTW